MGDRGMDIGPDEDRLNYIPPSSNRSADNDLEEDSAFLSESSISHGFRSRNGLRVYEPVDTTTDSADVVYNRMFSWQRPPSAPEHYKSEANRLSTFSDWSRQDIVRKEDLAKNGFVYTGTGDKVRCVFCNKLLREWEQGDIVENEHRRNSPDCPFVLRQNVGNIPLEPGSITPEQARLNVTTVTDALGHRSPNRGHDIDPTEEGYWTCSTWSCQGEDAHQSDAVTCRNNSTGDSSSASRGYSETPRNLRMSVEPERLATFGSWPAQMKQKPDVLAQAGLYYLGDGDKVKCFHCDGLLYDWDPQDDPFVEHARWFPDCQYIKLVKGESFVDDVKNGRETQDQVMQTPAVLAVLYEGHSVESVQKALAAMRKKNGASIVVTALNLLSTILELEDEDKGMTNGHVSSEDLRKLQQENESLKEKQLCKICMERDVEVIFLPCKHFVCCASCSAAVSACPICREAIKRVDKIFMA